MPRNLKEGDLECRLGKPNRAGDNERKISKDIFRSQTPALGNKTGIYLPGGSQETIIDTKIGNKVIHIYLIPGQLIPQ